jgi:hypothetical protein
MKHDLPSGIPGEPSVSPCELSDASGTIAVNSMIRVYFGPGSALNLKIYTRNS